jgi:hypothetical protein
MPVASCIPKTRTPQFRAGNLIFQWQSIPQPSHGVFKLLSQILLEPRNRSSSLSSLAGLLVALQLICSVSVSFTKHASTTKGAITFEEILSLRKTLRLQLLFLGLGFCLEGPDADLLNGWVEEAGGVCATEHCGEDGEHDGGDEDCRNHVIVSVSTV